MAATPRYSISATQVRTPPPGIDYRLGVRSIGRAKVDCALLARDTRWGTINRQPGGILHLKLTFDQPPAYKLRDASITLTMRSMNDLGPPELHVLEHVAPAVLCGLPTTASTSNQISGGPEIDIGGVVKLAGNLAKTSEAQQQYRWQFTAKRSANTDRGLYNEAICRWEANPKNTQGELVAPFRVAIPVGHAGDPFKVQVVIEGRLTSGLRQFKYSLSSRTIGPSEMTITPEACVTDIWTEVQGLQEKLAIANEARIPVIGPRDPATS